MRVPISRRCRIPKKDHEKHGLTIGCHGCEGFKKGISVNPSEVDKVIKYIANQKEHHCKKSFQEEYIAFLNKYEVAYDERYVWE